MTYIKDLPSGATRKINLGVGNVSAFVGYWNNNDNTNTLLAGEWSALEIIGVCNDNDKVYAKLRLTNYNTNKTYESILNASVFTPWVEMVNSETVAKYGAIAGEFKWYAGSSVPGGYLLCNGALINRETYKDLFAAIGTTYGAGDGSTTFALPNLIDRVIQGAATAGTYKAAGLPNITATADVSYKVESNGVFMGMFRSAQGAISLEDTAYPLGNPVVNKNNKAYKTVKFNASKGGSAIYGNSNTVQPPALTMLPIIKY